MAKRNPVAKNVNTTRPATHKDRKRASKRGARKHKPTKQEYNNG